MIFTIVWILIICGIIKSVFKSEKPDYVVEWEEKVKENEGEMRIGHTVWPETRLSEKEWFDHIKTQYHNRKN